jgi:hypothetical protein
MVMSQELQTFIMNLLPPTRSVHLTEVTVEPACVRRQLTTTGPSRGLPALRHALVLGA